MFQTALESNAISRKRIARVFYFFLFFYFLLFRSFNRSFVRSFIAGHQANTQHNVIGYICIRYHYINTNRVQRNTIPFNYQLELDISESFQLLYSISIYSKLVILKCATFKYEKIKIYGIQISANNI